MASTWNFVRKLCRVIMAITLKEYGQLLKEEITDDENTKYFKCMSTNFISSIRQKVVHSYIFYSSPFRNATVWSRPNDIQITNDPLPYIDV